MQLRSPYAISIVDVSGHIRKLKVIEDEVIRLAIVRYDGNMTEVARRLAIGRSTLYRKLEHRSAFAPSLKLSRREAGGTRRKRPIASAHSTIRS